MNIINEYGNLMDFNDSYIITHKVDSSLEELKFIETSSTGCSKYLLYDALYMEELIELEIAGLKTTILSDIFNSISLNKKDVITERKWKINNIISDSLSTKHEYYKDYICKIIRSEGHDSLLYLHSPYEFINFIEKLDLVKKYISYDYNFVLGDIPVLYYTQGEHFFISYSQDIGIANVYISPITVNKKENTNDKKTTIITKIGYYYNYNDIKCYDIKF